jgi:hypothetical protein
LGNGDCIRHNARYPFADSRKRRYCPLYKDPSHQGNDIVHRRNLAVYRDKKHRTRRNVEDHAKDQRTSRYKKPVHLDRYSALPNSLPQRDIPSRTRHKNGYHFADPDKSSVQQSSRSTSPAGIDKPPQRTIETEWCIFDRLDRNAGHLARLQHNATPPKRDPQDTRNAPDDNALLAGKRGYMHHNAPDLLEGFYKPIGYQAANTTTKESYIDRCRAYSFVL